MTTNETKPDYRAEMRKAVEESKCAAHRDDIGALLDLIGQQANESTCSESLRDIRTALKEIAARRMYHLYDNSEVATNDAIEDNLTLLRETAAKIK